MDLLLGDLRALYIELEIKTRTLVQELLKEDIGRRKILTLLKEQFKLTK